MKIVAVGDIGVDIYLKQKITKPGGISFNFAYQTMKSNAAASIIAVIGDDTNGKKMMLLLKKTKLDVTQVRIVSGTTPVQKINLESNGERKFAGYDPGVLTTWKLTKNDLAFLVTQDAIFVPLSDGMKHIFEKVAYLKTKAIKIADFSQDSEYADFDKKENIVTKYCKYFDINFVGATEKEIPLLSELSKKYKDKLFVLTLGSKGSIGFINGKQFVQKAQKVKKIVDTTGAGDAFQASFLVKYLKTQDIEKALQHAAIKSAANIAHIGSTALYL